jgi:hypothetical protein
MTKLIFYKARDGQFLDKVIGFFDNGKYSHVEIVLEEAQTYWLCVAASARDGGVRINRIYKTEKWDVVKILEEPARDLNLYLGSKYDWPGLVRTFIDWFPAIKGRWVCSTFAAEIFGLEDPKSYGVQDFYEWARSREKD